MENKKKKGILRIFNLFDLILIAVAAALAAVLLVSLGDKSSGITGPVQTQTQIRYTVELTGIENGAASLIKAGDPVVDKIKKYSMGTVESVEVTPTVRSVPDETSGVIKTSLVPGQETATVVITATASETDRDITVDGGYIIKVGLPVSVRIPGLSASGFILDVERGDAQ